MDTTIPEGTVGSQERHEVGDFIADTKASVREPQSLCAWRYTLEGGITGTLLTLNNPMTRAAVRLHLRRKFERDILSLRPVGGQK